MTKARHTSATTSIRMVWPFATLARRHGHNIDGFAAKLGLTASQFEDPDARVPTQLVVDLLREAIELTETRDLGLLAAHWVDATHLGIGEYLARVRPTLRAAMEDTGRYLPLLTQGLELSVEERRDRAVVRLWFRPELEIHEAVYEFIVAIAVLRARRLTGDASLAPETIHFIHPRPKHTARHEATFGCAIHFGAEITRVTMTAKSLDTSLPAADPTLAKLLADHADDLLARLPVDDDLTSRVTRLLAGEVALREVTAYQMARRVGVSTRTLSRRLAEEGTTYRRLLDAARRLAAMRELVERGTPITTLAERLGFASRQSFHRAFRRWTGTTADAIRREFAPKSEVAGRRRGTSNLRLLPSSARK